MVSIPPPVAGTAGLRAGSVWSPIALTGLAIGTLDLVFVFSFWGLGYGVPPTRILQSIAAGLQGAAAFQGGGASALLGAACHYLIATAMAAAWFGVSARWRRLRRHPWAWGVAYGLALYAVMTWVVVPLSNAPPAKGQLPLAWTLASVAMHALIGVICAVAAARAGRLR